MTALQKLAAIRSADAPVAAWVRALQARNTSDYRPLAQVKNPTSLERIEWFRAFARSTDPDVAWPKLTAAEKQSGPDFCRAANEENYSVEVGHELLQVTLPLELREI